MYHRNRHSYAGSTQLHYHNPVPSCLHSNALCLVVNYSSYASICTSIYPSILSLSLLLCIIQISRNLLAFPFIDNSSNLSIILSIITHPCSIHPSIHPAISLSIQCLSIIHASVPYPSHPVIKLFHFNHPSIH